MDRSRHGRDSADTVDCADTVNWSLAGRQMRPIADVIGGEVTTDTVFDFDEREGVVSAPYEGGAVQLGFLVGTRRGVAVAFRYVQLNTADQTSAGVSRGTLSLLPDGRICLDESWSWDSRPGGGRSRLQEIAAVPA